ncbi:MAG: hypothetical protein FWD76_06100 [Firmicutes bacterium]|nr:hypothetical protein [Bacillota bacterium]
MLFFLLGLSFVALAILVFLVARTRVTNDWTALQRKIEALGQDCGAIFAYYQKETASKGVAKKRYKKRVSQGDMLAWSDLEKSKLFCLLSDEHKVQIFKQRARIDVQQERLDLACLGDFVYIHELMSLAKGALFVQYQGVLSDNGVVFDLDGYEGWYNKRFVDFVRCIYQMESAVCNNLRPWLSSRADLQWMRFVQCVQRGERYQSIVYANGHGYSSVLSRRQVYDRGGAYFASVAVDEKSACVYSNAKKCGGVCFWSAVCEGVEIDIQAFVST